MLANELPQSSSQCPVCPEDGSAEAGSDTNLGDTPLIKHWAATVNNATGEIDVIVAK
jgi:hypothetical protein